MSTDSKRQRDLPTTISENGLPLRGSDFFPPGTGWNHAKPKRDDSSVTQRNPFEKYSIVPNER